MLGGLFFNLFVDPISKYKLRNYFMSPTQKKRLFTYSIVMVVLGIIIALVMYALSQNMNAYYTPTEIIKATEENPNILKKNVRLGGMVKPHSLKRSENLQVAFVVTDYTEDLFVTYRGILPDLFREGQGIVAEGQFVLNQQEGKQSEFLANRILAKHDEEYMPETIKKRIGTNTEWK